MPLSAEHKQRSRQAILDSAVTLFTQQGFDNTSIDQIMAHAQLTRGGFYAHFTSKSDLYQQAMLNAASHSRLAFPKPDQLDDEAWFFKLLDGYLSNAHLDNKQTPCPLAFLVTDVAVREAEVRSTYASIFKKMHRRMYNYSKTFSSSSDQDLLAMTAMMIGSVAIARTMDDGAARRKLLQASKQLIHRLLSSDPLHD